MAMGAFASPLSSGKRHEMKYCASPQNRRACFLVPGKRYGRHIFYSRNTEAARLQFSGQIQQPVLNSSRDYSTTRFCNASLKRRILSRVECFVSSDQINSGWLKPRTWENFTSLETCSLCPASVMCGSLGEGAAGSSGSLGILKLGSYN